MNSQARVLFIGIVQDGKVVQERAMPPGETVTVGTSNKCTFVLPETPLGRDAFPLFTNEAGRYSLQFTDAVKGRVTTGGSRLSLDKAVRDGNLTSDGGIFTVPLEDSDKGKIRVGPVTILFKFVTPTAIPSPAPVEKLDFRPTFFQDDEDPVFVGFMALWAALGLVFGVAVTLAEAPEITIDELPDRFAKIMVRDVEPLPVIEDGEPVEGKEGKKVKAKAKAKAQPSEPKADAPPNEGKAADQKVDQAKAVQDAKADLREQSALFKELQARMIGTTGENASGTVLLNNAAGNYDDIAGKLAAAESAGATLGDGSRIRGGDGVPGGTGDRNIGGVEKGADLGAGSSLGEAPKIEAPKGNVSAGDLDFGGGDVAPVAKVVRKYQGQLKYCYEKSLKANPSLSGRVVVAWVVEDESALDIYIEQNTTGDSEIASCIKGKVKRWKFSGIEDGDAKQTFVFTPED